MPTPEPLTREDLHKLAPGTLLVWVRLPHLPELVALCGQPRSWGPHWGVKVRCTRGKKTRRLLLHDLRVATAHDLLTMRDD